MTTIAVIIPCTQKHFNLLSLRFEEMLNQTIKPDQVIVSLNIEGMPIDIIDELELLINYYINNET